MGWIVPCSLRPLKGAERKRKTMDDLHPAGVNAWAREKEQDGQFHGKFFVHQNCVEQRDFCPGGDAEADYFSRR
jgi:hypothetical protein